MRNEGRFWVKDFVAECEGIQSENSELRTIARRAVRAYLARCYFAGACMERRSHSATPERPI